MTNWNLTSPSSLSRPLLMMWSGRPSFARDVCVQEGQEDVECSLDRERRLATGGDFKSINY